MDRLGQAIYMIRKAQEEKERLNRMNWELAQILPSHPLYNELRRTIIYSFYPIPSAESINQRLRYAREILREEFIK